VIALLIVGQRFTSDAIYRSHNPFLGHSYTALLEQALHNYFGVLIGCLMAVRLLLRAVRKPLDKAPLFRLGKIALLVQYAFYAVIIAQAGTGFIAAYYWSWVGNLHSALWLILLFLSGLHVAAAAYHAILKDGVFSRMIPFERVWRDGR
jgi:cytochrome b561